MLSIRDMKLFLVDMKILLSLLVQACSFFRLRSHRNIRYTVYGIRYTLYGIRYTLYGHGGSHRSSTFCQCALFVSMKNVANLVFYIFMRIQIYAFTV